MNTPYLIQRMKFEKNPVESPSVDQLMSMDYMGSAEFEFGSLPKSLKEFTKRADELQIELAIPVCRRDGQRMFLIGTAENIAEYQEYMQGLYEGKYRLKEHLYLDFSKSSEEYDAQNMSEYNRCDAWWDIDNHVMFTFGKANASKIVQAIKVVRDNKKAEGKKDWIVVDFQS